MKGYYFYVLVIYLSLHCSIAVTAQEQHEFPPYTIAAIYKKHLKRFPFIEPITALPSHKFQMEKAVIYEIVGQDSLKVDVFTPPAVGHKKIPVVILIHGGGWLTGSRENQNIMAQHLASNGYGAMTVSYRLGFTAPYPAAVQDIKSAIRWARKNAGTFGFDPDKIILLGASAGGHLATLAGVTPDLDIFGINPQISDAVQAIVNLDGIVSFVHPEASAEGKMASQWLGGSKETHYEVWKAASPLEYVNASSPPVLFVNSSQPRFHAGRDDMMDLLKNLGIYHRQVTLESSPHSFWLLHPWFEPTLQEVLSFIGQVFQPD